MPIVFVFLMGCVAAALSLSPDMLRGLHEGIQELRDQLDSTSSWSRSEYDVRPAQMFFRITAAILILLSVAAFAAGF